MAPLRHIRRSRRLSHKSPMEVADYDWQDTTGPKLLNGGSDVAIAPSVVQYLLPPFPSPCTTPPSDSPPAIVSHLPFAPGSSHTRNRKEGHIPRPPNAFMVFRSWLWNKNDLKNIEKDNRNVSRIAGRYWNQLTEAERAPFRSMAEEAKARHAQLYPEYRYSPGSQKKPKVAQRRPQRGTDGENEKYKKLTDVLLGGVARDSLAKYLGDEHRHIKRKEEGLPALAADGTSFGPLPRGGARVHAAPRGDSERRKRKAEKRTTFVRSPVISAPPQHTITLPTVSVTEVEDTSGETTPTPGLFTRTPDLVYPPSGVDGFVPTDDIPYLSLDGYGDLAIKAGDDDPFSRYPPHLKPGAHSVLAGVKPEATWFVDSCVLGAYTINAPAHFPVPVTDFDIGSDALMEVELVPFGSPVFTNPFESSALPTEHAALLGTLDQMFGQSISPLTPIFPRENL